MFVVGPIVLVTAMVTIIMMIYSMSLSMGGAIKKVNWKEIRMLPIINMSIEAILLDILVDEDDLQVNRLLEVKDDEGITCEASGRVLCKLDTPEELDITAIEEKFLGGNIDMEYIGFLLPNFLTISASRKIVFSRMYKGNVYIIDVESSRGLSRFIDDFNNSDIIKVYYKGIVLLNNQIYVCRGDKIMLAARRGDCCWEWNPYLPFSVKESILRLIYSLDKLAYKWASDGFKTLRS